MARVKRTTLVPWIAVVVPTAQMSVAETAEILDSTAFAKLVPDGTAGTGTGTTDQAVPSQCSASGRASLPWPTAQALAGLRSATSYSDAILPPLAAAGVGTMVHAVPFQCAARVLWLAALMLFVFATSCHCVPFQRSAKFCEPASSPAPGNWPTAQASVAVRAETALRVVADGLTLGTTVQVGVAAMAVPASRASEAPAASATGMSRCRMLVPSCYVNGLDQHQTVENMAATALMWR